MRGEHTIGGLLGENGIGDQTAELGVRETVPGCHDLLHCMVICRMGMALMEVGSSSLG